MRWQPIEDTATPCDKATSLDWSAVGRLVRRRTLESLKRVRTLDNLLAWSERWEGRLTEAVSFPPPPIGSCAHLTPLSTADAMRREALEMQNCLDEIVPGVLEGSTYFFHWNGGEPATVMLVRDPGHAWQFQKALGFDNQPVDHKTVLYIHSLIQARLAGSKEPGFLDHQIKGRTGDENRHDQSGPRAREESVRARSEKNDALADVGADDRRLLG